MVMREAQLWISNLSSFSGSKLLHLLCHYDLQGGQVSWRTRLRRSRFLHAARYGMLIFCEASCDSISMAIALANTLLGGIWYLVRSLDTRACTGVEDDLKKWQRQQSVKKSSEAR